MDAVAGSGNVKRQATAAVPSSKTAAMASRRFRGETENGIV